MFDRSFGTADGCWTWTGAASGYGTSKDKSHKYGHVQHEGRTWRAHRLAWIAFKGPLKKGDCVLHSCDNTLCINPDHLRLGTQADNIKDAVSKRRHPHGETTGTHKLTWDQVEEIRDSHSLHQGLMNAWELHNALAADYNVSASTIAKIVRNQTWRAR